MRIGTEKKERHMEPENELWQSVLEQAYRDLFYDTKDPRKTYEIATRREEAMAFFFKNTKSLEAVCYGAQIEPDRARKFARQVLADPSLLTVYAEDGKSRSYKGTEGKMLNRALFEELIPRGYRVKVLVSCGFSDGQIGKLYTKPYHVATKRQGLADALNVKLDELWLDPVAEVKDGAA